MEGKDELTGLLQERFTEHELPVDPAVWEGVQAQLVAATVDADLDLFRDRFNGHETAVDPGVWQGIAGQLGHGAAAGTTAGGGLLGGSGAWVGVGIVAVAITGGIWWYTGTPEPQAMALVEVEQETPVAPKEMAATPDEAADMDRPDGAPVSDAEQPTTPEVAGTATRDLLPANEAGEDASEAGPAVTPARTGQVDADQGPTDRGQPVPATLEPRLTSSDTGVQDPHGLEVVQRILGEAVNETAQHPRPEQEEAIPPPPVPVEEQDVQEEAPEQTPLETTTGNAPDELTLFIPNVFSPNNDLVNDELRVQGEGFQEVRVRIYNANNNQLVFAAESLKPWDGRDLSGQPCPDGFYFYAIEAVDRGGRLHTKGQAIRLFR